MTVSDGVKSEVRRRPRQRDWKMRETESVCFVFAESGLGCTLKVAWNIWKSDVCLGRQDFLYQSEAQMISYHCAASSSGAQVWPLFAWSFFPFSEFIHHIQSEWCCIARPKLHFLRLLFNSICSLAEQHCIFIHFVPLMSLSLFFSKALFLPPVKAKATLIFPQNLEPHLAHISILSAQKHCGPAVEFRKGFHLVLSDPRALDCDDNASQTLDSFLLSVRVY